LAAMLHYAIIANGSLDLPFLQQELESFSHIIACDGGLNALTALHITPSLFIGDGDSVGKIPSHIPQELYPTDKDLSDLELAIKKAFSLNADKVTVYGALGKRTDHTLSNLFLLSRYPEKVLFKDTSETLFAISTKTEFSLQQGSLISFFSLHGPVEVSTQGLQWNLNKQCVDASFFSLSNTTVEEKISIEPHSGTLLLHCGKEGVK